MFPLLPPAVGPSWCEAGNPAPCSLTFLLLLVVMVRDRCCLLAQASQNSLSQFPASAFSMSVDITPWPNLGAIRFLQAGNETFAVAEWAWQVSLATSWACRLQSLRRCHFFPNPQAKGRFSLLVA